MKYKQQKTDWARIEEDWRAGIRSIRDIAKDYNISHVAIYKHFKKLGIPRDLKAKINAERHSQLVRDIARMEKTKQKYKDDRKKEENAKRKNRKEKPTELTDTDIIRANAQVQKDIILSHQKDIKRYRKLVMKLLTELEDLTSNESIVEMFNMMVSKDGVIDINRAKAAVKHITSITGRTESIKKLSDVLKTLIALERQAFGINDGDGMSEQVDGITIKVIKPI